MSTVLYTAIKWQAIPKGLTGPSRNHVAICYALREGLERFRDQQFEILAVLQVVCSASTWKRTWKGDGGIVIVIGFKGTIGDSRAIAFIAMCVSLCEYSTDIREEHIPSAM